MSSVEILVFVSATKTWHGHIVPADVWSALGYSINKSEDELACKKKDAIIDGILLCDVATTLQACFLVAVGNTKGNSAICETLVTQQSAFIDTALHNIFPGEVNGFYTNGPTLKEVITYAGIEL